MADPYVTRCLIRRDLTGEHFECMGTKKGFKCGICKRGNLSLKPYKGQRCMCCHARVSQIIMNTDMTFPIRLSHSESEKL